MHKLVAIGGTFDRLHRGHEFFISESFKLGKKVVIGLTSDTFAKDKFSIFNFQFLNNFQVQNFQTRKKELKEFLKKENLLSRAEIVKIDDIYGPAIKNNEIEALLVTSDTLEGGRKVNRKRRSLGLPPLKLIKVPLVPAEDNRRIASTRIRVGEIDRFGKVYLRKIKDRRSKIKDEIRNKLKKPLGLLIEGQPENPKAIEKELKQLIKEKRPTVLITVGDVATKLCNEIGLFPQIAVIDFKVGRVKLYKSLSELAFSSLARAALARVRNPAGNITMTLVNAVRSAMKNLVKTGQQQIIRVIGEEDLAGVPAVLLAPLGSLILYGQPGEGIVAVEVTEEKKSQLYGYFS